MKNKVRKIAAAASVAMMSAPIIAMAQFTPPTDSGLSSAPITDIIRNAMKWILIIVGLLGVIGFAIAGILYLTAAGDEEQIKKAKSAMIAAIIGVVVALIGLVILNAVYKLLGAQSGF